MFTKEIKRRLSEIARTGITVANEEDMWVSGEDGWRRLDETTGLCVSYKGEEGKKITAEFERKASCFDKARFRIARCLGK